MKINKSQAETTRLVRKYIKKGRIKGKLDEKTGEIITEEALNDEKDMSTMCPNCGAPVNKKILTGENLICEYCGTNLSTNIRGKK
jgi:transposase